MQPEQELRAEHQSIRRGVRFLEDLMGVLREGHAVRNTDLYTLVDVLSKAATGTHQAKEEDVVFDFLAERRERFGLDGLTEFREDHEELNEMLSEVRDLVASATGGDRRARTQIKKRADRYGEAMREHLKAEEEAFLDRLHEQLETDEIEELAGRMASVDGRPKARARLDERVERLEDRYSEYV